MPSHGVCESAATVASYSRFAVPATVFMFSLAGMGLILADNLARREFHSIILIGVFAILTLASSLVSWREHARLRALAHSSPEMRANLRILVKQALAFSAVLVATAGLFGYFEGSSGTKTKSFLAQLQRRQELGDRLTRTRQSAEGSIFGYIEMCKSISPEVAELGTLVARLRSEYPKYADRYNVPDEQRRAMVMSLETDAALLAILRKEIVLARRMEGMDPTEQLRYWNQEMVPLINQEQTVAHAK